MAEGTLFLDIETRSQKQRYRWSPRDFFRLGQYAWDWDGPIHTTTSYDETIDLVESSSVCVAHNGHSFDWSVLYGVDSTRPLELAFEGRLFDTWTHATLVNPAPWQYTTRSGNIVKGATKPGKAMRWFSLDNQAFQLGVAGKEGDLRALALEFGDPSIENAKERMEDGFGKIPVDDPRFMDYAINDIVALRGIAAELLKRGSYNEYAKNEQINAAIDAQNSRNGFRVDTARAIARRDELDSIRDRNMSMLVDKYGMPIGKPGSMPLRTNAGKKATTEALASVGISLDDLPRTKKDGKDTDRPSFGGAGLIEAAHGKGEEAEHLARAIAAIGGLRPLAEAAMRHTQPDGFVHPQITTLQRSGRKSTTDPGLTTWTSRGAGAIEKGYFVGDVVADDEFAPEGSVQRLRWEREGIHVIRGFDLSQADSRFVAGYSGDPHFAERFEEGVDAHMLTAEMIWGYDVVHESPTTEATYRQIAKACGHAAPYGAGPRTIARTAKVDVDTATKYVRTMDREYPIVGRWQAKVRAEGKRGFVTNSWGRRMKVDRDREFTQSPALYGQSGTRELLNDGFRRQPIFILRCLKAQIHDEAIYSFPLKYADEWSEIVRKSIERTWQPSDGTGQPVFFPVGMSKNPQALTWEEASH